MPPKKSKVTKRAPAALVPPVPPAPPSIPIPASSEQTDPAATVEGTNSNPPKPIPTPPAPTSADASELPPNPVTIPVENTTAPIPTPPAPTSADASELTPNPVTIPVENTTAPRIGARGRGGTKRKAGKTAEAEAEAEAEASGDASATKKTRKPAVSSGSGSGGGTATENGAGGGVENVSDIHLEGEETDAVPVYDTCDEIRKKLTVYLRREGVTQAALLRALHAELRGKKMTSRLQSSQLARFLQMKGANTGNTSALFYASYVYFEKLRVKQGKPKSKHREEMERIWRKDGGFDIETPSSRGYFCGPGEYPSIDQYGRLLINGKVCH
ncbi:hypothetical protein L211DRAFT_806871 [Terfezia boudieri ATCC MYA-4762]|uniref:DUF7726 domain-containing protein n=1 Tax=Terfezia boudieri ATCC MYA-4762 TaxID=1051890 RepID=A0A3N4LUR7_9PEZI|nr:hypothetical protein L211DRAFT_806871 [Terfezia boudieri ATCC MYA-4762]